MSRPPRESGPGAFVSRSVGSCTLLVRSDLEAEIVGAGLSNPEGWSERLALASPGPGRGGTSRLALSSGRRLVLKKMRRGGAAGAAWNDRFLGRSRLIANVTIPEEVRRRAIPTAAPVALLLREGPRGLYQGWLAVEEIEGARDLLTRLAETPAPTRAQLASAVTVVRRAHDAGIDHRDLNLGNLLIRDDAAFLVDLDRASLLPRPLPIGARGEAMRRIERSYEKRFGRGGPLGEAGSRIWYDLYAGEDEDLRRKLRGGLLKRLSLAFHRLAWGLPWRRSRAQPS